MVANGSRSTPSIFDKDSRKYSASKRDVLCSQREPENLQIDEQAGSQSTRSAFSKDAGTSNSETIYPSGVLCTSARTPEALNPTRTQQSTPCELRTRKLS